MNPVKNKRCCNICITFYKDDKSFPQFAVYRFIFLINVLFTRILNHFEIICLIYYTHDVLYYLHKN
jgi:hypothetical protein